MPSSLESDNKQRYSRSRSTAMVLALLSRPNFRSVSAFSPRYGPALRRIDPRRLSHGSRLPWTPSPDFLPRGSNGHLHQYRQSSTCLSALDANLEVDGFNGVIAEEVYLDDGTDRTVSLAPVTHTNENNNHFETPFEVTAPFEPQGDQPQAIEQLVRQIQEGDRFSVLKGITGTGKRWSCLLLWNDLGCCDF
jgi:hypothetical protein